MNIFHINPAWYAGDQPPQKIQINIWTELEVL